LLFGFSGFYGVIKHSNLIEFEGAEIIESQHAEPGRVVQPFHVDQLRTVRLKELLFELPVLTVFGILRAPVTSRRIRCNLRAP
jgi:hypothetical protein